MALVASIIQGNKSSHIGDIARGLYQETVPDKGEEYTIGSGELFRNADSDLFRNEEFIGPIGVKPDNIEEGNYWLNAEILYNIHDCVVEIKFIK